MPAYEPVANDDEEESTDDQAIILAEIDDSKKSHINYKVGFCVVGSMVLATTALTGSLREVSEPIISELRETTIPKTERTTRKKRAKGEETKEHDATLLFSF